MTIGLVGVLYDLLLRRLLVSEVLDAVGVHESARSFGLKQISDRADLDLGALLEGANELTACPLDPLRWVDQDFEEIRRQARDHPLKVTLLIPAKDDPYVMLLAERLGKPVGQVEQMIDDAVTGKLGDAWDAEPVHKDAKLEIYRFAGVPTTGLIMTDRIIAIEAGPLIRYRHLERQGFIVVAERSKTPMERWITAQIDREQTDENISQIDARPRPTENAAELTSDPSQPAAGSDVGANRPDDAGADGVGAASPVGNAGREEAEAGAPGTPDDVADEATAGGAADKDDP